MLRQHINPEHPLMVGFSVREDITSLLGGVEAVTQKISLEFDALFLRYRFTHGPAVCVGGDYIFNLRFPLIGAPHPCAAISVTLLRVPPRSEWRQWLVRLVSTPPYGALALEDRTTLSDIQSDIAHLLNADPVIEGVNSTSVL